MAGGFSFPGRRESLNMVQMPRRQQKINKRTQQSSEYGDPKTVKTREYICIIREEHKAKAKGMFHKVSCRAVRTTVDDVLEHDGIGLPAATWVL